MNLQAIVAARRIFEEVAETARDRVLEEEVAGKSRADLVVIAVDCSDPFAVQAMCAVSPDFDRNILGAKEGYKGIFCFAAIRKVADALAVTLPDLAEALKIPVAEGDVPTFVMTGGIVAPFVLSVPPCMEGVTGEVSTDDVRKRREYLFDTYKQNIAELMTKAFSTKGWPFEEVVGLIIDMTVSESRQIALELMPDRDDAANASVHELPAIYGLMDREKALWFAKRFTGLEAAIEQPRPEGQVLVLVVVGSQVFTYYPSFAFEPDDPLSRQ